MNALRAVIEIGSTGIRLLVAEITSDNKRNILDRSEQLVNLGRDVFTTGSISSQTLHSCIRILSRYVEQLNGWGLKPEDAIVIATSAVREADNRDPFLDRIKIKTGFTVKVIDGIEENRLMYIAVAECLKDESPVTQKSDSIILEIAGGATEMMLMENGRMAAAHSLRLGTVIIEQKIHALAGNIDDAKRFIREFILNTRNNLSIEMNLAKVERFIAVGGDMKLAAIFAGKPVSPFMWEIQRKDFNDFVNEVQHYTPEECVARFKLNYNETAIFQISLTAYNLFVQLTNVSSIFVPDISIREGIIISDTNHIDENLQAEFNSQIFASASALLRKYQGDEKHSQFVRDVSLKIYDALQEENGLEAQDRILLEVSAILHDIGMFIQAENHNLHGKYIINNSEIFGLSREEKAIVAFITSFHKGKIQVSENHEFRLLSRSTRMSILKLSAILRLADALDRSHSQKLNNFTIHFAPDSITFRIKGHHNLSLEKLAVEEKCDLFENVFGYKVVLV
ncbi:HD domain-containing protein [Treponema sp.]|uniref:Ppx/GppA phosphatase family protein n=1 Tax=Treponema sp. TaxID=166 RepID=UPI0025EB8FA4|nr:HD domain-containing protein [Treponema sp.]MCR5218545.1 HD domain-containing protein [Treponema sp.]